MLVLARRVGQTIRISNNIIITPIGIKAGQIKIGVIAPTDVAVHREEVYQQIHRQHQAAGALTQQTVIGPPDRVKALGAVVEEFIRQHPGTLEFSLVSFDHVVTLQIRGPAQLIRLLEAVAVSKTLPSSYEDSNSVGVPHPITEPESAI